MKNNKINVACLILCIVWPFLSCRNQKPQESVTYEKYHSTISQSVEIDSTFYKIVISDTSNCGLNFSFSLNNNFWFNPDSMLNYIRNIEVSDTFNTNKEIIQAWEFVCSNSFHFNPISENRYIHHPGFLINSVGYGFCDDKSAALSLIWQKMGYNTRIHHVDGFHVFPEVYDCKKWKMLDPDYSLIYINKNGIASLDEIRGNKDIIPVYCKLHKNNFTAPGTLNDPYSEKFKKSYNNSYLDNSVAEGIKWTELHFIFPKKTTVEFPIIIDTISSPLCRITIPGNYIGLVQIPLIVKSIDNAMIISCSTIDEYDKDVLLYAGNLFLLGNNIVIYAYLNPLLLQIDNILEFNYHSNIKTLPKINIEKENFPKKNSFIAILKVMEPMNEYKDKFKSFVLEYISTNTLSISSGEDLYYVCTEIFKKNIPDYNSAIILANIKRLESFLKLRGIEENSFYMIFNDPAPLSLCILMLYTLDENNIESILDYYMNWI